MTDSPPERFTPARLASEYESGIHLTRTPHERRDQLASWRRSDRAFFASGACHILAYEMLRHLPAMQFYIETIRPRHGIAGTHAYVTDGEWAFDFNGWSRRRRCCR